MLQLVRQKHSVLSGNLFKWKKKKLSHDVITDIHSKLRETLSNRCDFKLIKRICADQDNRGKTLSLKHPISSQNSPQQ